MLTKQTIEKVLQQLKKLTEIHKNKSLANIYISLSPHDIETIQNISLCIKSFETAINSLNSILSQIETSASLNKASTISALRNLEIAINFYKKQYFLVNNLDYSTIEQTTSLHKEIKESTEKFNNFFTKFQKDADDRILSLDALFQSINDTTVPFYKKKI